jgi:hypothetical protein
MVQVTGIDRGELDKLGDDFTAHVVSAVRVTLRTVANDVTPRTTIDDLGVISTRWGQRVDDALLPAVGAAFWAGVRAVQDQVITHLTEARAQVAAAVDPIDELDSISRAELGFELPLVTNEFAELYLSNVRSRLVDVGNDVWEIVRGLLIDGLQAGEGVRDIAQRITSATGMASAQAGVVARTEINAAVSAGSLAQVRALHLTGTKTWIAVGDELTRPWHRDADGQTVDIIEKFMVGGEAMDAPLDGSASAGNVVSCRCSASFDIDDESASGDALEALVASASNTQTGAMIALVPTDEHLDRLALDGGEPRDQLHCTLYFLGEAADYSPEQRASLETNVRSLFAGMSVVDANGFGVNHWNPDGDKPSWNLAVGHGEPVDGMMDLVGAHTLAGFALDAAGVNQMMPMQYMPWSPHVCMAYSSDTTLVDQLVKCVGPVSFDKVRIAFASDVIDITLGDV